MLLVHDGPARTRCVLTVLEPARKERNSNDIRIEIKSSPVSWRKNSIVGQPVAHDRYTRFAEHTVLAHSDAHKWHTAFTYSTPLRPSQPPYFPECNITHDVSTVPWLSTASRPEHVILVQLYCIGLYPWLPPGLPGQSTVGCTLRGQRKRAALGEMLLRCVCVLSIWCGVANAHMRMVLLVRSLKERARLSPASAKAVCVSL